MWPIMVVLFLEVIKLGLLLQGVKSRRSGGFFLEG